MPALVLNPADTSTLMHDPKLSGFPVRQAAPPQPLVDSPSNRESILNKAPLSHHFHSLQPHQQQPYYGRSLSHPLALFGASRVPPLHPPYTEDMLDIRRHGSFLSVVSALKAGEYRGSLADYFRPLPGLGHMARRLDTLDLYHSDSLHGSGLGSSLPAQISTLYNRMMSQESSQRYRTDLSTRVPSLPSESLLSPPSSASILSSTRSKDYSHGSNVNKTRERLSLSMSPLRLSESSSLSPSSPSSSVSPSSSSHPYSHKNWASGPDDTPWSSGGITDRKIPTLPLPIRCENNAISLRDHRVAEGHVNPLFSTFLFQSPSWHLALRSKDMHDNAASRNPRMSQALSDLDSNSHRIPLDNRLGPLADWHYYHHHPHHHHPLPHSLPNQDSGVSEALLRSSSPRDLDHRASPRKELPTKVTKQNRVRERQEVTSILDADRDKSSRLSAIKKSASTQTQFSSFPHETVVPGPPPPPYFTTHDTILRDGAPTSSMAPLQNSYPNHHHLPPPPPPPPFSLPLPSSSSSSSSSSSPMHSSSSLTSLPNIATSSHHVSSFSSSTNHQSTGAPPTPLSPPTTAYSASSNTSLATPNTPTTPSSLSNHKTAMPASCPKALNPFYVNGTPPPPQYTDLSRSPVDIQHSPLNLSISNPSAMPGAVPGKILRDVSSLTEKPGLQRNGSSHEIVAEDEAIEEHFRRSLGQKYPNTSPSKLQNCVDAASMTVSISPFDKTMTAAAFESAEGVHITGSVDDHFARALGDQMWTAIKAKSEPPTPEAFPGTVDAHFAKALGASMWKKLQADAEVIEPSGNSPQHPQHDGHLQSPKRPQTSASPICPQMAM